MRVNIWIRKDLEDAWAELDNKSDFVNAMLAENSVIDMREIVQKKQTPKVKRIVKEVVEESIKDQNKLQKFEELKQQLDVKCNGQHFMSRKDCGKPGCPWEGVA